MEVPGEIIAAEGEIELNAGRERVEIEVLNTGDRDIQVRSHAHFFETNPALEFDRRASFGFRLDVASGSGVRFEPGISRKVTSGGDGGGPHHARPGRADARAAGRSGHCGGGPSKRPVRAAIREPEPW